MHWFGEVQSSSALVDQFLSNITTKIAKIGQYLTGQYFSQVRSRMCVVVFEIQRSVVVVIIVAVVVVVDAVRVSRVRMRS